MTLTHRLFLLVVVALLPAIAIQAYNELDLRRSREAEVHELALAQAQLANSEFEQILNGVRNLLTAVAEVPAVRALDTPTCDAFLATLQRKFAHLVTIAALDLQGRVACRQERPPKDLRFADRTYFRDAIESGTFVVGEYTEGRVARRPVLPLAMPLRDLDGRIIGVVAAALDLGWLGEHLRTRTLSPGGSLTIADRNGVIIAREPLPERFVGTQIPDAFRHLVTAPTPGSLEVQSQDGTWRVLGYVPATLPQEGLYVSAGLSSEEAYAAIERATTRGVALIGAGLLLALGAAWLAGRRFFHRPIEALLDAAGRLQAGDYRGRTGLSAREGEFGALGAAFDRMAGEIGRREAERDQAVAALRGSEARLRAVVESLPFDFWVIDREGRYVLQNPASRAHWGDRVGRRPEETASPPELIRGWQENNRRALAGEIVRREEAWPVDGELRHFEKIIAPIHDGDAILGAVGLNIDVTERRLAEERQRLLLAELNHRVKNTLAIVQVIARRSFSDGRSVAEAREALDHRLRALAKAHDLLTAGGWRGASFRALARAELRPYGKRAEIAGVDVVLAPRAAQTLGLILHELATNAAKHGAFSVPEGRVLVACGVEGGPGHGRFRLDWRESGGPVVRPPERRGFGSSLIENAVAHELKGQARLEFLPGGLVYTLEAPCAEVAAEKAAAA